MLAVKKKIIRVSGTTSDHSPPGPGSSGPVQVRSAHHLAKKCANKLKIWRFFKIKNPWHHSPLGPASSGPFRAPSTVKNAQINRQNMAVSLKIKNPWHHSPRDSLSLGPYRVPRIT
jgi:hypothetical protein